MLLTPIFICNSKETEGETVKIGNKIVTSMPDIIFPDFKESNEDLGIFAVCKVSLTIKTHIWSEGHVTIWYSLSVCAN